MDSVRYIGLDVHRDTISAAVLDAKGKLLLQLVITTRANAILDFSAWHARHAACRLRKGNAFGPVSMTCLDRRVARLVLSDPRKNALLKSGNKGDLIDARKFAELLRNDYRLPCTTTRATLWRCSIARAAIRRDRRHDARDEPADLEGRRAVQRRIGKTTSSLSTPRHRNDIAGDPQAGVCSGSRVSIRSGIQALSLSNGRMPPRTTRLSDKPRVSESQIEPWLATCPLCLQARECRRERPARGPEYAD